MTESRETFVAQRKTRWQELEMLLIRPRLSQKQWSELARLYRSTCSDLSRARSTGQPKDIQSYLDELAARAHNALYSLRPSQGTRLFYTVFSEFPRELRDCWQFFGLANLLFYGPFLLGFFGALFDPTFAQNVLPAEELKGMRDAYGSSEMARSSSQDMQMAGFYVWNNVGIALRCFATGALAGLGPLFYLAYNGLIIGTVAGYLTHEGIGHNLLSFIAGHGPWELTGVVVAGTAGLKMGWSMISRDGKTLGASMMSVGPSLYRMMVGTITLLLMAACIEGFWSAGPFPPPVKWLFGMIQVCVVAIWLGFGGRKQ